MSLPLLTSFLMAIVVLAAGIVAAVVGRGPGRWLVAAGAAVMFLARAVVEGLMVGVMSVVPAVGIDVFSALVTLADFFWLLGACVACVGVVVLTRRRGKPRPAPVAPGQPGPGVGAPHPGAPGPQLGPAAHPGASAPQPAPAPHPAAPGQPTGSWSTRPSDSSANSPEKPWGGQPSAQPGAPSGWGSAAPHEQS